MQNVRRSVQKDTVSLVALRDRPLTQVVEELDISEATPQQLRCIGQGGKS